MSLLTNISETLGDQARDLINFKSNTFEPSLITRPGPDFVSSVYSQSDRSNPTLRSLQTLFDHCRLGGTGYLSILPVDQGVEHSAGASFAKNPIYFDPENIVKLAVNGNCSAVVSTLGSLGLVSRSWAHKIPFVVKLNHNQTLTYPNEYDQIMFGQVEQAWNMGAVGVGATIFFGSPESNRQIHEVAAAFKRAHELGMLTILWCYLRNDHFMVDGHNLIYAADLQGQANHLGVTIEADIIKQKPPKFTGGYKLLNSGNSSYGKLDERMYTKLSTPNPIDLTKYQVANCYMGKIPLINSGDPSGDNDNLEAVKAAVINKRGGGAGLIMGRKVFQRPMDEGLDILKNVQNVYLCSEITIA